MINDKNESNYSSVEDIFGNSGSSTQLPSNLNTVLDGT